MGNMFMALFCMLVWAWALYEHYSDTRTKIFSPVWWYILVGCDIFLVISFARSLITMSPVNIVLFILAICEFVTLVIKAML